MQACCKLFLASIGSTLLSGLLVLACCSPARAQAEAKRAAALNWVRATGSEACIDAPTLARRVEERLGRSVFPAPAQASLIVEGSVAPTEQGFAATLRIFDQEGKSLGSRELSSAGTDCKELSETVVLVLAVMVDPDGALAAIPKSADPPKPTPPAPRPPPKAPAKPKADVRPRDISGFARIELGTLPEPALGAGLAAMVSFSPLLTFRIEGVGFFERTRTLGGIDDRGARFWQVYGGAQYCPLFLKRLRFGFLSCVGPTVGAVHSRSFGLDPRENDQTDLTVNAVAQLRVDAKIVGPIHAVAAAGFGALLVRTLYQVTDTQGITRDLFEPDALLANFDLGLSAAF